MNRYENVTNLYTICTLNVIHAVFYAEGVHCYGSF